MSRVVLLCADHPLPLYGSGPRRVETSSHGGYTVSIERNGFSVQEHKYYRGAVEDLGLSMKPCQYELDLDATEEDARQLRDYLARYGRPGEQVELWNLWVGDGEVRALHLAGPLRALDRDTLEQLLEKDQTRMTITI